MNKLKILVPLAVLIAFSTLSCTREGSKPSAKLPEKNPVISTLGETLLFDKSDLYVKAGDDITLKFINNASAMKHNFVLVKPGKADEVGIAGIKAGEIKDYIPDSPDMVAHTKLIGKGEEIITFKAPSAGDYPYICSSAGHHTVMRGMLHSIQ